MSKLLSELEFASYLAYSPKGQTQESLRSRQVTYCLKSDAVFRSMSERLVDYVARRIAEEKEGLEFGAWFEADVDLVPMPRSSRITEHALWPARRIANALVQAGLGRSVLMCLSRKTPLPRASQVRSEDRPTAEKKLASLGIEIPVVAPKRILVVDDVITTGRA